MWKAKNHSISVAQRWVLAYDAAVDSLELLATRSIAAPEAEYLGGDVRHLLFKKNFRLIYRIVGQEVHVLHVRHAARLWLGQEPDEDE